MPWLFPLQPVSRLPAAALLLNIEPVSKHVVPISHWDTKTWQSRIQVEKYQRYPLSFKVSNPMANLKGNLLRYFAHTKITNTDFNLCVLDLTCRHVLLTSLSSFWSCYCCRVRKCVIIDFGMLVEYLVYIITACPSLAIQRTGSQLKSEHFL